MSASGTPGQSAGNIHTEGGAYIDGSLATQMFVGRDNVTNVTINVSGSELRDLTAVLFALLATPTVTLHAGQVSADGQTVNVPPELADALRKFLDAAPGQTQAERERQYLLYLCVNPDFQQWQQRYVALSGGYRAVPELPPSFTAIQVRGEGSQRQIERVGLPDIRTALDQHAVFVLLAQPGAGKTTVLQRVALDMATSCLQEQPAARLPLFVRLAAQEAAESPRSFLARMWREQMPASRGDAQGELQEALRRGRLCLLVDALNEARRENYSDRMFDWREFAKELPPGNQLVFSCRTLDYNGELAVQQVEIDPLTAAQIEEFAVRYLGEAKGPAFWETLQTHHADLLDLARTPYYLPMLVAVYDAQGDLPANRAGLFAHFVDQLFAREEHKRHAVPWIQAVAQLLALSELAFAIQEVGEGTQVDQQWAKTRLPAQVRLPDDDRSVATPPDDVLALARAATFLAGDDQVKFSHHLMQEYFAAVALLRRVGAGHNLTDLWRVPSRVREMKRVVRGEWDPLPLPETSGWEETTILAAGLNPTLYDVVQPTNPALAARCLLESGAAPGAACIRQSRNDLLKRLGDPAVHVRSRIEAGLLLGRLGDPRFPVETIAGVSVIVPPMVEIAGAEAQIGSGLWQLLTERQDDEKPRHTVVLDGYAIGQYPVTNAEYACFVAAGGYEDETWWTAGGKHWLRGEPVPGEADPADRWIDMWRRLKADSAEIDRLVRSGAITQHAADNSWRILITWDEERVIEQVRKWYPQGIAVHEPRYWQDADFNNPSQPVVGVCWYEAMAYANWLAAVTGEPSRLPSEPEWEWAARRGGRHFPWGSGWDPDRLNSLEGENRVMRTTPVGAYAHGATPDGIYDLAGNVWEWTATLYAEYPYRPEANPEDPDATGVRVVRGEGWTANRKMVRCAYRHWNLPWFGDYNRGFRLARLLSH